MSKRARPIVATAVSERVLHVPVDQNPLWLPIFDRLADWIGLDVAMTWFGHCRFVQITAVRLDLASWWPFVARESLQRCGASLARGAGGRSAHVPFLCGAPPVQPLGGAAGG